MVLFTTSKCLWWGSAVCLVVAHCTAQLSVTGPRRVPASEQRGQLQLVAYAGRHYLVILVLCGWSWKQLSETLYVNAANSIPNRLLIPSYSKSKAKSLHWPDSSTMTHTTSMSILVLGHFANFKLAGDRAVRDAVLLFRRDSTSTLPRNGTGNSQIRTTARSRRRRRGTRARHVPRSTRIGVMTDADLEAELAARRTARARERERYARAMRTEKLSHLEGELVRLRSEISRLGRPGGSGVGSGTPPNARWEALPQARNRLTGSPLGRPTASFPNVPPVPLSGPSGAGPPPPPPPPGGVAWEDEEPIDPERQKREKEERVRRREAKRKEREAAKKPMTLADIIRGAGPDPMRRLKPSGSTQLEDVFEFEELKTENFSDIKDTLKKVERTAVDTHEENNEGDASKNDASEEEGNKKDGGAKDEQKATNQKASASKDEDKSKTQEDVEKPTASSNGGGTDIENDKKNESRESDSSKTPSSGKPKNDSEQKADNSNSNDVSEESTRDIGSSQRTASEPRGTGAEDSLDMKRQTESVGGDSKTSNNKEPQTSGETESSTKKEDNSGNSSGKRGSNNDVDASSALSALSSLASKLPSSRKSTEGSDNSGDRQRPDANETNAAPITQSGSRRKLTLEERRRRRRAAAEQNSESTGNGDANGVSTKPDSKIEENA